MSGAANGTSGKVPSCTDDTCQIPQVYQDLSIPSGVNLSWLELDRVLQSFDSTSTTWQSAIARSRGLLPLPDVYYPRQCMNCEVII
jgi:hypothetical protein